MQTELRPRILGEQSARNYAIPPCGCVEEAAGRARGSRQCRQNTCSDVAAPRSYTGVAVIVTGALRVGSPVSVVWRPSAVGAVGGGAGFGVCSCAREATSPLAGGLQRVRYDGRLFVRRTV